MATVAVVSLLLALAAGPAAAYQLGASPGPWNAKRPRARTVGPTERDRSLEPAVVSFQLRPLVNGPALLPLHVALRVADTVYEYLPDDPTNTTALKTLLRGGAVPAAQVVTRLRTDADRAAGNRWWKLGESSVPPQDVVVAARAASASGNLTLLGNNCWDYAAKVALGAGVGKLDRVLQGPGKALRGALLYFTLVFAWETALDAEEVVEMAVSPTVIDARTMETAEEELVGDALGWTPIGRILPKGVSKIFVKRAVGEAAKLSRTVSDLVGNNLYGRVKRGSTAQIDAAKDEAPPPPPAVEQAKPKSQLRWR